MPDNAIPQGAILQPRITCVLGMASLLLGSLPVLWWKKPMRCFSMRSSWERVTMPCSWNAESADICNRKRSNRFRWGKGKRERGWGWGWGGALCLRGPDARLFKYAEQL